MGDNYNSQDRVFSAATFAQFSQLNINTNSRIPIFFCIDISASMRTKIGFFETRISLLSKVMKKLLENMKEHPILGERAVIGIVTYNDKAVVELDGLDISVVDISKVTAFSTSCQTICSKGLKKTIQAIDQYRDNVRRSDVDTFKPMLVFMTDGIPVGDDDSETENVYQEIQKRIKNNDLYVFSIGISKEADMEYVESLHPDKVGYQIINEKDFEKVFCEIEKIVNTKSSESMEKDEIFTKKASKKEETLDTGGSSFFDFEKLETESEKLVDFH